MSDTWWLLAMSEWERSVEDVVNMNEPVNKGIDC